MIETIFIARHGFRLNWITPVWESPTGLPRDPPLTAFGIAQARELADHFLSMSEDQRPTLIFSSPYYRCLQTSQPSAQALGQPIYVEHGLSEWYSPAASGTGLHPRPASATILKAYFSEIDPNAWSSVYYPTRKGEDVDQLQQRAHSVLSNLISEIETRFPNHKRVLLVSHAATVIAFARDLSGDKELPLRVGCCTLSEFHRKEGESKWEAKRLAEGDFLTGGIQRDWGLEDIQIADGKVVEDAGVPGSENEIDEPVGSLLRDEGGKVSAVASSL